MKYIHLASVMLLNGSNELLLVRKKGSTFHQLVGGKIEAGETAVQAAVREVREEIGLAVAESDLVYLGEHEAEAVNESDTRVKAVVFKYRTTVDFYPSLEERLEEYCWLNTENYLSVKWAHLAEEFVQPLWLDLQV